MTAIASQLINGLLSVKPLAKFAKNKARTMMMDRAETIGVYWRDEVKALRARGTEGEMSGEWEAEMGAIANPTLEYPRYYTTSFHAYDEGNLGWLPALEVDVAARAVHARIWPEGDDRAGINGDASLRSAYHEILKEKLTHPPERIIDLGCSVGRSTMTLQDTFPGAIATGVDLSPYFLTVAQHAERTENRTAAPIQWVHAAAEDTQLPARFCRSSLFLPHVPRTPHLRRPRHHRRSLPPRPLWRPLRHHGHEPPKRNLFQDAALHSHLAQKHRTLSRSVLCVRYKRDFSICWI